MKKNRIFLLILLGAFLGGFTGMIVWMYLKFMTIGIKLVWGTIPNMLGLNGIVYRFAVCIVGGIMIGLLRRKFGVYPETLEDVISEVKEKGGYRQKNIFVLLIAALLPLIFGASVGPEAGLSGVIAALATFIGTKIKSKGEEIKELSEAGVATALGVVFNAPFYGLVNDIEYEICDKSHCLEQSSSEVKCNKLNQNIISIVAVLAGFAVIHQMTALWGLNIGISRFTLNSKPTVNDWKFILIFIAGGIVAGVFYSLIERISNYLASFIKNDVVLTVCGGIMLATLTAVVPYMMFSGEYEMSILMKIYGEFNFITLILIAFTKIFITRFGISFGWRGGHIFPLIFSGCALGYALVFLTGVSTVFGVAVTVASICGYVIKKPAAVVAILFLCFPVRLFVPITAAALLGSYANKFVGSQILSAS